MDLATYAKSELKRTGDWESDPAWCQSIVAAAAAFSSYGHSGGSAAAGIAALNRLLQFQPLGPLTSDPGEWVQVAEDMWQNVRDGRAFSHDGGKTWKVNE